MNVDHMYLAKSIRLRSCFGESTVQFVVALFELFHTLFGGVFSCENSMMNFV